MYDPLKPNKGDVTIPGGLEVMEETRTGFHAEPMMFQPATTVSSTQGTGVPGTQIV